MLELVDNRVLETRIERCEGSNPSTRTIGLLCGGSSPYWCASMKIDRVRFPAGATMVLLIWEYGGAGRRNGFKIRGRKA